MDISLVDVSVVAGVAWALTQVVKMLWKDVPVDPRAIAFLFSVILVVGQYLGYIPTDLVKLVGAAALATLGASAGHSYGFNANSGTGDGSNQG